MRLLVNGGSRRAWKGGALAVLVMMAAPQGGAAARAETLLDALAAAYQYSPLLDAERARLRATDEEVARANSGYRPQVGFEADVGRENTRVRPSLASPGGTTSPRGYSVNLVQPVFRGFQVTNAVNEAEAAVRAGRETLRGVEQQVLQDAVTAYANVVRDQAIVRLREDGLEFFNQELKATRDRFAVGEVTRTDVAQAEARRALAVGDLDASRANLKSSRALFEQVVGHAPQQLTDPGWKTRLLPGALNEAIAISTQENPNVVAALYREQGARFTVERIRGELLPSAQLEASYSERFDSSVGLDEVDTASLVGRVNVPIYTGGEVEARVRQAKHTHISRIQEIEQARAQAQSAVAQAWAQLQGAKAQHEADKTQIEANRTALNGVREEEKVGQRTLLDVLNARQELLVSEIQSESTKRNVIVATYAVVAAIGRLNVAELGAVSSVYDPVIHADEVRRKWFGIDITHDDGRQEHHDFWRADVTHEPVK
ncbi:MAG TPA: TolC family outer membrane protein [Hyphomicrobium sp.]|nr:TolC family outer membrane protein [Hyphomicrobium sp.]